MLSIRSARSPRLSLGKNWGEYRTRCCQHRLWRGRLCIDLIACGGSHRKKKLGNRDSAVQMQEKPKTINFNRASDRLYEAPHTSGGKKGEKKGECGMITDGEKGLRDRGEDVYADGKKN